MSTNSRIEEEDYSELARPASYLGGAVHVHLHHQNAPVRQQQSCRLRTTSIKHGRIVRVAQFINDD